MLSPEKKLDPATGAVIAEVATGTMQDYEECVKASRNAYKSWSNLPAPQRGEIVRQIGEELRKNLQPLGKLVSLGKNALGNFSKRTEFFHSIFSICFRNGKNFARRCWRSARICGYL